MPRKIKVLWVVCCILILFGFLFFSAQRSVEENRAKAKEERAKMIEESTRKRQIEEFKQKSFKESAGELKELAALGKYDETIKRAREILEKDPANAPAYTWWGISLVKTKRFPEAIEKFEKSTQLDQTNSKAYIYWGLTLAMQEQFGKAISKYRSALQIEPENSNAYAYWGGSLAGLENYSAAIEKLEYSLNLNPFNKIAYGVLVDAFFQTRQYKKAWDTVSKARKNNVTISEDSLNRLKGAMPEPAS